MTDLRREIMMLIGRLEWTIADLRRLLPPDYKDPPEDNCNKPLAIPDERP